MNIFKWFKTLFRIVREYDKDLNALEGMNEYTRFRADQAEKVIRDRTELHVDVRQRSASHAILIGEYRGRDFIQAFNIPSDSLEELLSHVKYLTQHAHLQRVDCHPELRAVIEHKLNNR